MTPKPKAILLTNSPAPYREPVYERLARLDVDLVVVYCTVREPQREWKFSLGDYPRRFLQGRMLGLGETPIHFSRGVGRLLSEEAADVVITGGFSPPMLRAFFWARMHGRPHIAFSDATIISEKNLGLAHRVARRIVHRRSAACVGAGLQTLDYFRSYGVPEEALFRSCLTVATERFSVLPFDERPYDVMFSGRFVERKMPLFFAEICCRLADRRGSCRALVLGSGPLEEDFRAAMRHPGLTAEFAGFVDQETLPEYYASAKILAFPTLGDTWGVVANEACAAGTPVSVSRFAGVAGDLVQDRINGRILELDPAVWTSAAEALLDRRDDWGRFSGAARRSAESLTFDAAASGLRDAIHFALRSQS